MKCGGGTVRGKGEHGVIGACLYRNQPPPLLSLDACDPNSFCFVRIAICVHFAASGRHISYDPDHGAFL
jgi:hypothetical protein